MHFLLTDNQQLRTIIFFFEKKVCKISNFCHTVLITIEKDLSQKPTLYATEKR